MGQFFILCQAPIWPKKIVPITFSSLVFEKIIRFAAYSHRIMAIGEYLGKRLFKRNFQQLSRNFEFGFFTTKFYNKEENFREEKIYSKMFEKNCVDKK